MLKIINIKFPAEAQTYFSEISNFDGMWIVSDLMSKLVLRQQLLETKTIIQDSSVLRAHELWKSFLLQNCPGIRIISSEYALQIISKNLKEYKDLYKPGLPEIVFNYMRHLMPLLSNENSDEVVKDFFSKNELSKNKWFHWYNLAKEIWTVFKNKGILVHEWCSSYLVNEIDKINVSDKKIFFNLGCNLQSSEAEIIIHLSKKNDVTVFVPTGIQHKNLRAYELLDANLNKNTNIDQNNHNSEIQILKLTTQLAEVKAACSIVRKWLDQNIGLNEIAIAAPDIGLYWPVLHEYLKVEGIPTKRSLMAPLKTFPSVQNWLSNIKLYMSKGGNLNSEDLEMSLFSQGSYKLINYDEFRRIYSKIYDWSDLNRNKEVNNVVNSKAYLENSSISKDKFLTWAISFWDQEDSLLLEQILNSFYQETVGNVELAPDQWFEILDSLASRKEVEVESECKNGIYCLDVSSVREIKIKKVIVLGVSENQMKTQASIHIDEKDIQKFKQEYGFYIPYTEQSQIEFDVEWLLKTPDIEFVLSYPKSDFDGSALAPSILWLREAVDKYGGEPPFFSDFNTRFSEIQNASPREVAFSKSMPEYQLQKLVSSVERDLGNSEGERYDFTVDRLSATAIEDYLKCPFVFTSKKILKLSDLPDIDLDIDYMTRGRLIHEIFSRIVREPFRAQYSDQEIDSVIEEARKEINFQPADEMLWDSIKKRYLNFTRKFVESEKIWRGQFPQTKTIFKEIEVKGYLEPQTGNLTKDYDSGRIPFYGKIDRIDVNEVNQALIIDYKYSANNYKTYSSWIKAHELQLGIYALAAERGLIENINFDVVGSIYFSIKEMERVKGFLVKRETGLYNLESSKRNMIDDDKKSELFAQINQEIKQVLNRMKNGEFYPGPDDESICKDCNWRSLCRAPHLM